MVFFKLLSTIVFNSLPSSINLTFLGSNLIYSNLFCDINFSTFGDVINITEADNIGANKTIITLPRTKIELALKDNLTPKYFVNKSSVNNIDPTAKVAERNPH